MAIDNPKNSLIEELTQLDASVSRLVTLAGQHQGIGDFTLHQQIELNDELTAYFDSLSSVCSVLGNPLPKYAEPDSRQWGYREHFLFSLDIATLVVRGTLKTLMELEDEIDIQKHFWLAERFDQAEEAINVLHEEISN